MPPDHQHKNQSELVSEAERNPFRLFFPLGVFIGVAGVSPWLVLLWGVESYPVVWHRLNMINGFMFAFVAGFLMTAIPRFTKTAFASTSEVVRTIFFVILSMVLLASSYVGWHYVSAAFGVLSLMIFAFTRFLKRQENPPYTFLLVGLSLLGWATANLVLGMHELGKIDLGEWLRVWQTFLFQGIILGLILGVGGRLIPGILGWTDIVGKQRASYERPLPFWRVVPISLILMAIVFFSSYFIAFISEKTATLFRLGVVVTVGFHYWRIHRFPKTRTQLSWSIWITAWALLLSGILPLFWKHPSSHSGHSYFISGFSLLTLLVATRVTLSHARTQSRDAEAKSKTLSWVVFLLLLAAATRVLAILWPDHYLRHLGYAALLWVAGVIIWTLAMARHFFPQRKS